MHVQNPSEQPLPWLPYMTIWTCLAHKIMLMAIFIWYAFCLKVQKRPRKPYFSVGPNIGLTPKLMWFLLKADMRQLGHPPHLLELVFSFFSSHMALWVQGSLDFFGMKGCCAQALLSGLGRDTCVPLPLPLGLYKLMGTVGSWCCDIHFVFRLSFMGIWYLSAQGPVYNRKLLLSKADHVPEQQPGMYGSLSCIINLAILH